MAETAPTRHSARSSPRRHFLIGSARFSTLELLIALVVMFVVSPFVEEVRYGHVIEGLLMTVVLSAAVFAVGGRRRTLVVAAVLGTPAVAGRWIHHFYPELVPRTAFLGTAVIFVAFVIVNLLRFALRAPRVNTDVLCAAISAYLMLGLLWAFAYTLLARLNPNAFSFNLPSTADRSMEGFTAFYFSFVTLSTVGFGDITPANDVARMLAVMEAMTGLLYVAVLIARMVALYSSPAHAAERELRDER